MNNSLPKWVIQGIGGLLIAFLALLIIDKAYDLQKTFANRSPENTVSVSAEGKVSGVPDLAIVNVGVLTSGSSATDVQSQSSQKINRIIDFVKGQGVPKEDIATSQFNIYPLQDYREGNPTITGYQANQTIEIKVHGVDKGTERLSAILGGVTGSGANQVNGVSLTFDDPDNMRQEARKMAIEKAKEKAQDLAATAGLRLGKVVSVSESGAAYPPGPIPYAQGLGGADKAVSPNVETGSQDVIANMTVVFEVK